MEATTAAFIIAIIELAMKYGVPAVMQLIKDWEVEDPTLEEIQALKDRVPRPETYFDKE